MGIFRKDLFDKLARASDIKSTDGAVGSEVPGLPGITYGDIAEIEKFKNIIFKVLMLRAGQFVHKTLQESDDGTGLPRLSAPQRFAVTEVKVHLSDFSIHPDKAVRGIIPQALSPDLYDDTEIMGIVNTFSSVYNLACD